eukprot:172485-Pleurochrysis_carterae.AAC.1
MDTYKDIKPSPESQVKLLLFARTDDVFPCSAATVAGDCDIISDNGRKAQEPEVEHAQVGVVVVVVVLISVLCSGVGVRGLEIRKPVENACKYVRSESKRDERARRPRGDEGDGRHAIELAEEA